MSTIEQSGWVKAEPEEPVRLHIVETVSSVMILFTCAHVMEGGYVRHHDLHVKNTVLVISLHHYSAGHEEIDIPDRVTGVVVSPRGAEGFFEVSRLSLGSRAESLPIIVIDSGTLSLVDINSCRLRRIEIIN